MTWCARCDVLTTGSPGDECPTCGAPVLETPSSSERRSRTSVQVLERNDPIVDVAVETAAEPIEAAPPVHRPVSRRSRLVAAALVVAIAGGAYAASRPDPPATTSSQPAASSTPSGPSWGEPDPPFGTPVPGFLLMASEHSFTKIDLVTGELITIEVSGQVQGFSPAPGDGLVAYLDQNFLMVVPSDQVPIVVAADVDAFAWEGTERLVVARRQTDAQGRDRLRFERINLAERTSELLVETYATIASLVSRGGRVVATIQRENAIGVYEVRSGALRTIRSNARLLDLSFNGKQALIATYVPDRLLLMDIRDRSAKRIGGSKFMTWSARFAPDGKTALVSGTPHFSVEKACDNYTKDLACGPVAVPTDHIISVLDLSTLKLRRVVEWSTPYVATDPEWGPEGWILTVVDTKPLAISLADGTRIEMPRVGADEAWMPPQFMPE